MNSARLILSGDAPIGGGVIAGHRRDGVRSAGVGFTFPRRSAWRSSFDGVKHDGIH